MVVWVTWLPKVLSVLLRISQDLSKKALPISSLFCRVEHFILFLNIDYNVCISSHLHPFPLMKSNNMRTRGHVWLSPFFKSFQKSFSTSNQIPFNLKKFTISTFYPIIYLDFSENSKTLRHWPQYNNGNIDPICSNFTAQSSLWLNILRCTILFLCSS